MRGGCGGFPLVLLALGSPEASDHDGDDISNYAEGPDPCDAGWAGCCVVPCDWEEEGGEPVCSCAWNWASCSGLASVFSRVFSCSSWEFFSISSLICSLRTSTSSLTAYIKWLFTRSWNAEQSTWVRKAAQSPARLPSQLSQRSSGSHLRREPVGTQLRSGASIPARASSPLLTSPGPDRRPFGRGSGAGQSPIKTCRGSLAPTGTEDGDRDAVTTPLPAAPPHTCGSGAWPRPPSPWPRPLGPGPAPAPRTGCSQFWAQVAAFPSLPPAVRGRRWRQGAPRPIDARVIYSRELKARSLPSNSRQRLPWERLQAPLQ